MLGKLTAFNAHLALGAGQTAATDALDFNTQATRSVEQ